mgnify:CR=1 FL=1
MSHFSADMDVKLNLLDAINTRMVPTEGDVKTLIRLLVGFGTLVHQVKFREKNLEKINNKNFQGFNT